MSRVSNDNNILLFYDTNKYLFAVDSYALFYDVVSVETNLVGNSILYKHSIMNYVYPVHAIQTFICVRYTQTHLLILKCIDDILKPCSLMFCSLCMLRDFINFHWPLTMSSRGTNVHFYTISVTMCMSSAERSRLSPCR